MLHLILGILKVIGFILLAVLLLLVLGLLALLFVPVRYELAGKKSAECLEGRGKVSWLFHLVGMAVEYREKHLELGLQLCGITIKSFGKADGETKKRTNRRKKKKPERRRGKEKPPEETEPEETEPEEAAPEKPGTEERKVIIQKTVVPNVKTALEEESSGIKKEDRTGMPEAGWNRPDKGIIFENVMRFIAGMWEFFLSLPERIFAFWWRLQELWESGGSTLDKIARTKEEISQKAAPFLEESSRALYGRLLGQLKYLWTCYRPRKVRGWLRFGTGAPDLTGELTGLLYLWLPASADKFELIPDFAEAVLEMDILLKGRIRACHLGKVAFVLWRDKELRKMIRRVRAKGGK